MSTDQELAQRLAFMRMDAPTRAALRGVREQIAAALPGALDQFYAQMRGYPDATRFFSNEAHVDAAKGAQTRHWMNIASGEFNQDYLSSVRRIGQTHARIGLEPRWYIGGYALILEHLIRGVMGKKPKPQTADAIAALTKAALLDMDLAITVYLEAAAEGRARLERERELAQHQQRDVVAKIADGLNKMSDGDLTTRIPEAFPSDYEQLRHDFNGAVSKLESALGAVVSSADSIRGASGEIATAADDLSQRSEQQAASLEQTAAAVEQITVTVRKTADGAIHASDVVARASADARASGDVVINAVKAMDAIERSASEIEKIIGVIDGIAFQTNLLALNAGVEAARAGDAGRGFAVVASEVRALAQRSADAAKQIKALIAASTEEVGEGVRLVNATGEALKLIVSQVSEINAIVDQIAASAKEQAGGLQQVNVAVSEMDRMTQQNAAMVEETTAASHSLSHEADALTALVSGFAVGGAGAARSHAQTPMAAPRQRRAVRVAGGGAQEWEEF